MMGFSLLSMSRADSRLSAPAARVTTTRVYVSYIIGNYRPSGFSVDPRFVVTILKSRCVTSVPGLPWFSSLSKQTTRQSAFVCRTLRTLTTSSRFHRPVAFYSVTNTNLCRGLFPSVSAPKFMPVYRYSCWDRRCTGLSPVISTLVYCHVIISHPLLIELLRHLMNCRHRPVNMHS